MKLYKLECLNEDGDIEINGYYLSVDNATISKLEMDNAKRNIKYGIEQHIIEIETED